MSSIQIPVHPWASIPGMYCGVEVRVISVVFYTCRLCWFRWFVSQRRVSKTGSGGQSPCHRSHKHVSQIPWGFKGVSQSSRQCPTWSQQVQGTPFPFWTRDSGGDVFSSLVSSTTIGHSFEPNELLSECWWISILITLSICLWDKESMGEGVVVRSFFGEDAWSGGNSSLNGELLVEEVEGEALQL